MNVLIGDIGGTKTILAVYAKETGPRKALAETVFPSTRYESLGDMIKEFLARVRLPVEQACFGVAGPVFAGRAKITNLKWVVDGPALQSEFKWSAVELLNDMESIAYAIPILAPEDVHTLSAGEPVEGGALAILAPGTGLGEGYLTFENGRYRAHPSEGSHASFAPVGPLQIGLLTYLNQHGYDHVSTERVCSGRLGVPNLYAYLKSTGLEEPAWLAEQLAASEDPTPVIINAAQDASRPCKLAAETLDLFIMILGAEAGNLGLKVLSSAGIYLGGGMPPRLLAQLEKPAFLEALRSKGRFRGVVTRMPVHVIINTRPGMLGAAAYGLALSASG
ncbi:MAG TPA: glucokinase [Anaerolineales bacterium]|nr:glucokinase [Anaerolineales bacterium]